MESKRAPRKLKWASIPNDDAASKLCATDGKLLGGKRAASGGQERKRSQANWKNAGEVTRNGDNHRGVQTDLKRRRAG